MRSPQIIVPGILDVHVQSLVSAARFSPRPRQEGLVRLGKLFPFLRPAARRPGRSEKRPCRTATDRTGNAPFDRDRRGRSSGARWRSGIARLHGGCGSHGFANASSPPKQRGMFNPSAASMMKRAAPSSGSLSRRSGAAWAFPGRYPLPVRSCLRRRGSKRNAPPGKSPTGRSSHSVPGSLGAKGYEGVGHGEIVE